MRAWAKLSKKKALPWSLELIERFENRWDWDRAREGLCRTKVFVLSSSAMDGLMTQFAYLEHEQTVARPTRDYDDDVPF